MKLLSQIFVGIILFTSCASTRQEISDGNHLTITSITVQKIVPGTEDLPVYDLLQIELMDSDPSIVFDSVYFENRVFPFVDPVLSSKVTLKTSYHQNGPLIHSKKGTAVIFYHVNKKGYQLSFDHVDRLQDLVMP